jgi:putative protein kinase ArgK-like GTPase of G3E family
VPTSALTGEGIVALREAIDHHRAALDAGGLMAARRAAINERRLLLAGEEILRRVFAHQRDRHVSALLEELNARRLTPHAAAKRLFEGIRREDA